MCLLIEVVLPDLPSAEAGALTRAAVGTGVLEIRAKRQKRGEPGARFSLGEPGEGCACSLAGEEADWNAPYYVLRPEAGERLARTLEFLASRAGPAGLGVRAAWVDAAAEPLRAT